MVMPAKPPEPRPLPEPVPLPAGAPDPVPNPVPDPAPCPASVPVPPLPEPVSVPRPVPSPPPPAAAVPPLPLPAPITISSTLLPAAALAWLPIAAGPVVALRCFEPGAVCADDVLAAGETPKRALASAAGILGGGPGGAGVGLSAMSVCRSLPRLAAEATCSAFGGCTAFSVFFATCSFCTFNGASSSGAFTGIASFGASRESISGG